MSTKAHSRVRHLVAAGSPLLLVLALTSPSQGGLSVNLPKASTSIKPSAVKKQVSGAVKKLKKTAAKAKKRAAAVLSRPIAFSVPEGHLKFAMKFAGPSVGQASDFKVIAAHLGKKGRKHSLFQQHVAGVPVFGGEVIVHANADGTAEDSTDELVRAPALTGKKRLSAADASKLAEKRAGCSKCVQGSPELYAVPQGEHTRLAYRVKVHTEKSKSGPSSPVSLIDAETGEALIAYDDLQMAKAHDSLYSGKVELDTFAYEDGYVYLLNQKRRFGTFDMDNTWDETYSIVDYGEGFSGPAVDAHFGLMKTLEYYRKAHDRNGVDDQEGPGAFDAPDGTPLLSQRVSFGENYGNAYWDGVGLTYGNGNGSSLGPMVALDVVAHELTHGVVDYTADLVYQGESGALNESFADVFAAMVERHVRGETTGMWLVGEDVLTPGVPGDAVRSLANPTQYGKPDHYSEAYDGYEDNGGVHINSSIPNHVFYLLAKGGKHRLGAKVTGIGAESAAAIWYMALRDYMTSTTDFAGARVATLKAASSLYGKGSDAHTAVCNAWLACGVGETCAPQWLLNGRFDSASPWTFTGTGSFTRNSKLHRTRRGYAYIKALANAQGAIEQELAIPKDATTAALSFYLNVTTSEQATTAKDVLSVEILDTKGKVLTTLATFSNANKGKSGVYSAQGPHDLAAYKGSRIRLRFSATGDAANETIFRIDDVVLK